MTFTNEIMRGEVATILEMVSDEWMMILGWDYRAPAEAMVPILEEWFPEYKFILGKHTTKWAIAAKR